MNDIITIIIPTYNRESTLLRSVNSVLNQTYSNIEIIIVDDNSADKTEDIITNIKDNRVKYVKNNQNRGACFSRNLGIELSTGKYIAFQDSDDEWNLDKLEKQLSFMKNNNYDIVSCQMEQIYDNGKRNIFPNINIKDLNLKDYILWGNVFSTQTILGKKRCFIDEKFDINMPRFQDWELMIRMSKKYHIGFLNEILVDAYIQDDSISKNNAKAVKALDIIKNKYTYDNKLKSFYFRNMAVYSLYDDKKQAYKYFNKAYQNDKNNYKNKFNYALIKLNLLNLLKLIYKLKRNI